MFDRFTRLAGVSPTVAAIIVALIVVQLALQVYSLVDLVRREAVRGGMKWLWALIIVLGNLLGAIGYLAFGRVAPTVDDSGDASRPSAQRDDAAHRAVDELYGPRDRG